MSDMELIAGNFLIDDLPKDKIYLSKYFDNPMAIRFLVYYFIFVYESKNKLSGAMVRQNFIDHTGLYCQDRVVYKWIDRIKQLMSAESKSRADFDIESVHQIRTGNFKAYK